MPEENSQSSKRRASPSSNKGDNTKSGKKKPKSSPQGNLLAMPESSPSAHDYKAPDPGLPADGTPPATTSVIGVPDTVSVVAPSHLSSGTDGEEAACQESYRAAAGGTDGSPPVDAGSQTWLLPTNHLNMLYMLSAGMLMGPAGFGGKHYRDPANVFPGWLPLFRNKVPEAALDESVSERKNLQSCIAGIDIKKVRGPVRLVTRDGNVRDISLPATIDGDVAALLVPAPLPLTLLTRLRFLSEEGRTQFDRFARDDPTIDLARIHIEVLGRSSSETLKMIWPPAQPWTAAAPGEGDKPPARGQAIGGVLAMLYHLANRSDLCCSAYRIVTGAGTADDDDALGRDAVLRELPRWLADGAVSSDAPPNACLYWGVAQTLVDARLSNSTSKPVDSVVEYLAGKLENEKDKELRSRLGKLIRTMRDTFGMSKGTVSDLLKQHPGSLSRPLLLLCLRERCKDLLEFSELNLRDEELVLAAILFGIREGGWRKLPSELRRPEALTSYVTSRMFEVEQERRGDGRLALDSAPSRPKPLRELVPADHRTWGKELKDGLVRFVSERNWTNCIVTHFRLPEGNYQLRVSSEGVDIVVHGVIQPLRTEIDREILFKRLSQWPPLPTEIEDELRSSLLSERARPCE